MCLVLGDGFNHRDATPPPTPPAQEQAPWIIQRILTFSASNGNSVLDSSFLFVFPDEGIHIHCIDIKWLSVYDYLDSSSRLEGLFSSATVLSIHQLITGCKSEPLIAISPRLRWCKAQTPPTPSAGTSLWLDAFVLHVSEISIKIWKLFCKPQCHANISKKPLSFLFIRYYVLSLNTVLYIIQYNASEDVTFSAAEAHRPHSPDRDLIM